MLKPMRISVLIFTLILVTSSAGYAADLVVVKLEPYSIFEAQTVLSAQLPDHLKRTCQPVVRLVVGVVSKKNVAQSNFQLEEPIEIGRSGEKINFKFTGQQLIDAQKRIRDSLGNSARNYVFYSVSYQCNSSGWEPLRQFADRIGKLPRIEDDTKGRHVELGTLHSDGIVIKTDVIKIQ